MSLGTMVPPIINLGYGGRALKRGAALHWHTADAWLLGGGAEIDVRIRKTEPYREGDIV